MAARAKQLIAAAAALVLAACSTPQTDDGAARAADEAGDRIVSLVPALTETLFAIGAGPLVVGVSSYDSFPPEVESLPRVGALVDPDTERILALRPTLVMVYDSQAEAKARLERAGIRLFTYRHGGIDHALETMRRLGALTHRAEDAERLTGRIRQRIDAVRARVEDRPPVRTLLVIDRQPASLRSLYASGGVGFLNEMLHAAGGVNVFEDVARESVQPSHETLLARAPDVILEVRASAVRTSESDVRQAWSTLASIPAVEHGRIHVLTGGHLVVPGPRIAEGVEAIAGVLHP